MLKAEMDDHLYATGGEHLFLIPKGVIFAWAEVCAVD
jgi:hypothetical protein